MNYFQKYQVNMIKQKMMKYGITQLKINQLKQLKLEH